jgi:hypothetical protein
VRNRRSGSTPGRREQSAAPKSLLIGTHWRVTANAVGERTTTLGRAAVRGPTGREGREEGGQRVLATLKESPLLRWVKVARPAAGEVVFHPEIGLPAPARKLVKSAEAVPQSMLGLETV